MAIWRKNSSGTWSQVEGIWRKYTTIQGFNDNASPRYWRNVGSVWRRNDGGVWVKAYSNNDNLSQETSGASITSSSLDGEYYSGDTLTVKRGTWTKSPTKYELEIINSFGENDTEVGTVATGTFTSSSTSTSQITYVITAVDALDLGNGIGSYYFKGRWKVTNAAGVNTKTKGLKRSRVRLNVGQHSVSEPTVTEAYLNWSITASGDRGSYAHYNFVNRINVEIWATVDGVYQVLKKYSNISESNFETITFTRVGTSWSISLPLNDPEITGANGVHDIYLDVYAQDTDRTNWYPENYYIEWTPPVELSNITPPTLTSLDDGKFTARRSGGQAGSQIRGNTGTWSTNVTEIYSGWQISSSLTGPWNAMSTFAGQGGYNYYNTIIPGSSLNKDIFIPYEAYSSSLGQTTLANKYIRFYAIGSDGTDSTVAYESDPVQIKGYPEGAGAPIINKVSDGTNANKINAAFYFAYSVHATKYQLLADTGTNSTYQIIVDNITTVPTSTSKISFEANLGTYSYVVRSFNDDGYYWDSPVTTFSGSKLFTFDMGDKVYPGTNGYVALESGQLTDAITLTNGQVVGVYPGDFMQGISSTGNAAGYVKYWSNSSEYVIQWTGYPYNQLDATKQLRYQIKFYNGQQYADVKYVIKGPNLTTTYNAGMYNNGSPVGTTYANPAVDTARRIYFDGSSPALVSFTTIPNEIMIDAGALTSGNADRGWTELTTQADKYILSNITVANTETDITSTSSSVKITFSGQNGYSTYDYITRTTSHSGPAVSGKSGTDQTNNTLEITGLSAETTYYITITPKNIFGQAGTAYQFSKATLKAAPGAFTINAPTDSTQAGTATIGTTSRNSNIRRITFTWTKDTDVVNSKTYAWGTAFNPDTTESAPSRNNEQSDTEDFWGYDDGSGTATVAVNASKARKAKVTWGSSTNAGSYKVNYTIGTNPAQDSSAITSTSFEVETSGNKFTVNRVRAYATTDGTGTVYTDGTLPTTKEVTPGYNFTGTKSSSSLTFSVPGVPSWSTITVDSSSAITVTWSAPSGSTPTVSSYDILYTTSSTNPSNTIDPASLPTGTTIVNNGSGTTFSRQITSLTSNTTYYFWVRARSSDGPGNWSTSQNAKTQGSFVTPSWAGSLPAWNDNNFERYLNSGTTRGMKWGWNNGSNYTWTGSVSSQGWDWQIRSGTSITTSNVVAGLTHATSAPYASLNTYTSGQARKPYTTTDDFTATVDGSYFKYLLITPTNLPYSTSARLGRVRPFAIGTDNNKYIGPFTGVI